MFELFKQNKEKEEKYPKTKTEQKEVSKTYSTYEVTVETVSGRELSFQHEGVKLVSENGLIYGNKVLPEESSLRTYLTSDFVVLKTESQAPTVNLDNAETYDFEILEKTEVIIYYEADLKKDSKYGSSWYTEDYEVQKIEVKEVE